MSGTPSELKEFVVRAGAGAGKTYGLVERVTAVYREFAKAKRRPRIVLTTFTRKATQELKERLILKACETKDPAYLQFVSDPLSLHISTIHGLLNVFLKQVGHLAQLDSGFQIMDEREATRLARRAWREVLIRHPNGLRWFEDFGLNRTLKMVRAFDLKSREWGPLSPAVLKDIEEVANQRKQEWRTKLYELSARVLEEAAGKSWEKFGMELRRFADEWPESLPRKPSRSSKNPEYEDLHKLIEETLKPLRKELDEPGWNPERWPRMAERWEEFRPVAEEFAREFAALKERHSRFEMSDLELLTLAILKEKPFLGSIFAENWDYWMIDEFQDTSPLQVTCLNALIANQKRYLVGDPQQSIYLFRGSDVTVFAKAEKEMKGQGAECVQLRVNYRSEPGLLRLINDFMASVDQSFAPMEPNRADGDKNSACAVFLRARDADHELNGIVSRVSELIKRGAKLQDICVLGRTHKNLLDVAKALRAHGFPTHVHASRGFTARREVMDAQALWTFLLNPHDSENLVALLRSPWFFVPDDQIEAWMANSKGQKSLWSVLLDLAEDQAPRSVAKLKAGAFSVREMGVTYAFESLIREGYCLDLALHNDPAGRKESNLWKMIMKARALEREGTRSLLDLRGEELIFDPLDITEGDAASAQEPNCINLMTIHAAKGLEFAHVIIPFMGEAPQYSSTAEFNASEGKFHFPMWDEDSGENIPSPLDMESRKRLRAREAEELNRWLYVAVTRAKQTLTMSWSDVHRESWATRSPWFRSAAGVYDKPEYIFDVREEWPEPSPYDVKRDDELKPRPLWSTVKTLLPQSFERQSVTEILNRKAAMDQREPTRPDVRGFESRAVGQRIHRALENLKFHAQTEVGEDPAVRFVLGLKSPPMRELIREGEVEWGFQVQTKSGVLEGQIDLWGKANGRLFIIDYKTGSMSRLEQAFTQLEIYGWALRKFGHSEPMELWVIYPLAEKVERREFTEELFSRWEVELGLPQT